MPIPIEKYVRQINAKKQRWHAVLVWSIIVSGATIWIFLIIMAPIAQANNLTVISSPIYKFCGFICHQIPARSYFLENQPIAVCARCLGLYFGLFGGFVLYPFFRSLEETEPLPYFWLFLAMIPMAIDWSLGYFEIWENTHFSRLLTGLILGAVCATFIIPALIEIFGMLITSKQVKRLSI